MTDTIRELNFVSRNEDDLWSFDVELTEDNLRYLVEQLEGEEK